MLKIEHLSKIYFGTHKGIHDVSIHVQPGDLCAFIGQNGAGKTTTLKAIAGIHDVDSGTIQMNGIRLKEHPVEYKANLAYIPDNPDVFEYLTGIEYLNFIADVFGMDEASRKEQIEKLSKKFEMDECLRQLISTYSHGMKQKIALIGGLMHKPKLLVLDEPFVGLDPQAIYTLKECMVDLCNHKGAVLFSTHILDVAEKLCNKVVMIQDGYVVASGKMEDVIQKGQTLESFFLEAKNHV